MLTPGRQQSCCSQRLCGTGGWFCRGITLPELLDEYKFYAGLSVYWVMVGSADRKHRPQAGGVLRSYTRCEGHARGTTKVIANMFYAGKVLGTPHNLRHRCAPSPVAHLSDER